MPSVTFGKDRNWEGYIRVNYSYTQSTTYKQSSVTIDSIQFQSIEGRTCTWTAWGYIYFTASSGGQDYVSYASKNVYTSGTGWATLDSNPGASIVVNHDSNGNGYFTITLQPYGSYNDFNVFHPSGGSYNCEYSGGTNLTVSLPQIDSSGPTITLTASVDAQNNVTLSATSDVACSGWKYQVDGGFTWTNMDTSTSTTASATIPNMSGAHTFVVRATKTSNGVTGSSNAVSTDTPAVSWGSNTATSDDGIVLSITNLPANTTVRVKYGSTGLESNTWAENKQSVAISYPASSLKQWFTTAGVTTLQSITVTASIDGYPSATASFTLTAGNNMKPTVTVSNVHVVQPERIQQTFPTVWIANVSKAKIEATVSLGSNATIQSVVMNYGSESKAMTYNSTTGKYEATTSKPITGDTDFTIIATDTRGMTGRDVFNLTGVTAYSKPTITIDRRATYRCDSSGTELDGGPYVRVKATASYDTGLSGNTLEYFRFYVSEDGSSTTYPLQNGAQSAATQLISPRPDNAITIAVEAQDKISDPVSVRVSLGGAHRDFVVARYTDKTVVGIGQAPARVKTRSGAYCDGVDVASGGGYYVDGIDTINLRGVASTGTGIDTLWESNLLAIDTSDVKAEKNQAREFRLPATWVSSWQNVPADVVTAGTRFQGFREVRIGGYYAIVTIYEIYPVVGRIWMNLGTLGTTISWGGWKAHTPDIT